MWIVELAFSEAPERLVARPAHREVLAGLHAAGAVKMAGPLADDSGAVLVFDVAGREEVDAILAADPYYTTAGVAVVKVREWAPILG